MLLNYLWFIFLPNCVIHPNVPLCFTGEISTMNKGTMVELIPTENPMIARAINWTCNNLYHSNTSSHNYKYVRYHYAHSSPDIAHTSWC